MGKNRNRFNQGSSTVNENDPQQSEDLAQDATTGAEGDPGQEGQVAAQGDEPTAEAAPTAEVAQDPVAQPQEAAETAHDQGGDLGVQDSTAPAQVQEVAQAPVKAPEPVAPTPAKLDEIDEYLQDAAHNGTVTQKRMLEALANFTTKLTPNVAMSYKDAYKEQNEFLGHMRWLLAKDFDEFRKGWSVLLVSFMKDQRQVSSPSHYTALSIYNTARYTDQWLGDEQARNAYVNLTTVLRATANPETRQKEVSRIAFERVGAGYLPEKAITNLKSFYMG